jgi:hypothetical protein
MKRWWIIRHVRYFVLRYKINRHYDHWMQVGYLPVHVQDDYDVLDRIWRGEA